MKIQAEMDNELLEAIKNEIPIKEEEQIKIPIRKCIYCNKSLKTIGTCRKGGNMNRYDSIHRKYHMKCLKQHTEDQRRHESVQKLLIHGSLYDKYN